MLDNIFEWPNGQPKKKKMLSPYNLRKEGCNEILGKDNTVKNRKEENGVSLENY